MQTFALILAVINLGGYTTEFVLDYDLTVEDCNRAVIEHWANLDQYSFVYCALEPKESRHDR